MNLIVRNQNRVEASDNVKNKFKQKQIKFEEKVITSHSGYPCTIVQLSDKSKFTIIYKTASDVRYLRL